MTKQQQRKRRQARVRSRITGSADRPRLNVFRGITTTYVQVIDDTQGKTLVSVHSKKDAASGDAGERKGKTAKAYLLGKAIAEKAKAAGINSVVFDRAGFAYMGRVEAVAQGARDGGLQF